MIDALSWRKNSEQVAVNMPCWIDYLANPNKQSQTKICYFSEQALIFSQNQ